MQKHHFSISIDENTYQKLKEIHKHETKNLSNPEIVTEKAIFHAIALKAINDYKTAEKAAKK